MRFRISGNLLLAAFSLAGCLALVEGGARLLAARSDSRSRTERSFLRYHPTYGWEKGRGQRLWLDGDEFHVLFRTNSLGLRGPERGYHKPAGTVRILVLGDSFAEGSAVAEEATAAVVLEHRLNARGRSHEVLNAGTSGYSTDQELLYFASEGAHFQSDTVVLFFFSNDLLGNTEERKKPWYDLEGDSLVLHDSPVPAPPEDRLEHPPDPAPRLRPWLGSYALELLGRRTEAGNPRLGRLLARIGLVRPLRDHVATHEWLFSYGPDSEVTEDRWWRTLALLRALRDAVGASGARFVLLYVPASFEVDDLDWLRTRERWDLQGPGWDQDRVARQLKKACLAWDIPFVDPRPALRASARNGERAYFRRDPHWNAVGHRIVAETLEPFVRLPEPVPDPRSARPD